MFLLVLLIIKKCLKSSSLAVLALSIVCSELFKKVLKVFIKLSIKLLLFDLFLFSWITFFSYEIVLISSAKKDAKKGPIFKENDQMRAEGVEH